MANVSEHAALKMEAAATSPATMSVPDLRAELKRLGHDSLGPRHMLVARLEKASAAGTDSNTASKRASGSIRVHCKLGSGSWESCLQLCLDQVGFQHVSSKKKYDLLFLNSWKGYELDIQRLGPSQFLNRFPGLAELAQKAALADAIEKAERLNPGSSPFSPRTWVLPRDMPLLREQTAKADVKGEGMRAGHTYILKPDDGNQGDGIQIVQEISQVEDIMSAEEMKRLVKSKSVTRGKSRQVTKTLGKSKTEIQENGVWVLQEYVPRPLLLDGLKFDFRLYVMIAGVNPMRVYLCKQGMARFCTEPYQAPTAENISNTFMHLTNFAINKHHDDFTYASAANTTCETGEAVAADSTAVAAEGDALSTTATATISHAGSSHAGSTAGSGEESATDPTSPTKHTTDFENDGSKRLLASVLDSLREEGKDVDAVWRDVQGVVVRTCEAMQPVLQAEYDKWHTQTSARHEKREAMKRRCKAGFGGSSFGFGGGDTCVVEKKSRPQQNSDEKQGVEGQQLMEAEQQANDPPASPFRGTLHPTKTPSPSAQGAGAGGAAAAGGIESVHSEGGNTFGEKVGKNGVLFNDPPSRCFHIVGFDVLLDENLKPWLLEVNHSPSFNIEADGEVSEIDVEIKKNVLSDALRAAFVGFDPSRSSYEQLLPPPCDQGAGLSLTTHEHGSSSSASFALD
jgi:tubulin polyglutamylase TTLL11